MAAFNQLEKMNEKNYDVWSLQMRSVLVNADLWGLTNGMIKESDATPNWRILNEKALATIILHVSSSQLIYIKKCKTSWSAWEKLKSIHIPKGTIRKMCYYKKLLNLRMVEGEDVGKFINSFVEIADELEEIDIKLNDELKTIMLLSNLPMEYENFVIAIETRDSLPLFDIVKIKLLEEGDRRGQKLELSHNTNQQHAFYVENKKKPDNNKKFTGKCYICSKRGHMANQCRFKGQQNNDMNKKKHYLSYAVFMAGNTFNLNKSLLCIDSGATSHMCWTKNGLFRMSNKKKTNKFSS